MKKLLLLWSFTILVLPLPSLADDVYKWVDAEGKTHYGDSKQVDAAKNAGSAAAEKVDVQDANAYSADEAMTEEMRAALEKSEQARRVNEEKLRQQRADAAARAAARAEQERYEQEMEEESWEDYGLYYNYPLTDAQRRRMQNKPIGPITPGLKPDRPNKPDGPKPGNRPRPTPLR